MPFEVLDDREGDELKRGYALEHLQEQLREWEGSEDCLLYTSPSPRD